MAIKKNKFPKIDIDPSNTVGQASRLSTMVIRLDSRDGCPTGWGEQTLFSMSILGIPDMICFCFNILILCVVARVTYRMNGVNTWD